MDDPQPVECTECDGTGRAKISTRGNVADIDCPHCAGRAS